MLLLEGASFSVEVLDVVEPGDAVGDPNVRGFQAILERETKRVSTWSLCAHPPPPNKQSGSSAKRDAQSW